ncbi:MAG: (2Fe-2S)-binding protein, partial [Trebonia sp.]
MSLLPTAYSGLSDWRSTHGAERRVGAMHAGPNVAALALYAGSWLARGRGHRGVLSAMTGGGLLAAGGWLGG